MSRSTKAPVRHVTLIAPSFDPTAGGIQACSRFLLRGLKELLGSNAQGFEATLGAGGGTLHRGTLGLRLACATFAPRGGVTWATHPALALPALPGVRINRRRLWTMVHGLEIFGGVTQSQVAAFRRSERIVCVSRHTAECLTRQLPELAPRVAVLQNTFDEQTFKPARVPMALPQWSIRVEDEVVLSVGRLSSAERYKGFDRLIAALPHVLRERPRALLVLAGKGDDRVRLERFAREKGVSERVRFTGFVPQDELVTLFRRCQLFAMPSTGEGFGIVFLQALGCGKPVVGGNRDGSVDALANGELGRLIDPLSVPEIERSIVEALGEATARDAPWDDRLREGVVARFGRRRYRQRIAALLERG